MTTFEPTVSDGTSDVPAYDVALSFAGEQRDYVRDVAAFLRVAGLRVFFDEDEEARLGGTDLHESLETHYGHGAHHCAVLLSKAYPERRWPRYEAEVLLAKARTAPEDFLILLSLDGTRMPGVPESVPHVDLEGCGPYAAASEIARRFGRDRPLRRFRMAQWAFRLAVAALVLGVLWIVYLFLFVLENPVPVAFVVVSTVPFLGGLSWLAWKSLRYPNVAMLVGALYTTFSVVAGIAGIVDKGLDAPASLVGLAFFVLFVVCAIPLWMGYVAVRSGKRRLDSALKEEGVLRAGAEPAGGREA